MQHREGKNRNANDTLGRRGYDDDDDDGGDDDDDDDERCPKEETETAEPNQAVAVSKRHRHSQLGPASTSSTQTDDRRRAGGLGRVGGWAR